MGNKKIFSSLLIVLLMFLLCACAAPDGGDYGSTREPGSSSEGNENVHISAGQLTSSAYDDNERYAYWTNLININQEEAKEFADYHVKFAFKTEHRIEINVPKGYTLKISLLDDNDEKIYSAINDANGKCYLFSPKYQESYKVQFEYYDSLKQEVVSFTETISDTYNLEIEEINQVIQEDFIQLMFVIDATGSMGDEIKYLKAEIIDIIEKVKKTFAETKIELAMLIYRDHKDKFLTEYSDFTEDIVKQIDFLKPFGADGGGDFEEAVDVAMSEAASKKWSENAKTKLLIHVADAPSHDEDIEKWYKSTLVLSSSGVRIITVASSGIDKQTEFLFRSQSMITLGKYVYLNDDSGIGDSHLYPTIEEKLVVEYLNMCLVRLIKGYHTGIFEDPIEYSQVQE